MALQENCDVAHVNTASCPTPESKTAHPKGSGPRLDRLHDRSVPRGTPVTLGVSFRAASAVTITWRMDLTVIWRWRARVRHGRTRLTIRRFDYQHHRRRFSVEVVDRRGRRVWTAGTLKIRH